MKKFAEFEIHEVAIEIVYKEIQEIKKKKFRDEDDIARMEKLIRMYSTLMDNLRTNIRDGLHDKLVPDSGDDGT
jgi:hypothetical protein